MKYFFLPPEASDADRANMGPHAEAYNFGVRLVQHYKMAMKRYGWSKGQLNDDQRWRSLGAKEGHNFSRSRKTEIQLAYVSNRLALQQLPDLLKRASRLLCDSGNDLHRYVHTAIFTDCSTLVSDYFREGRLNLLLGRSLQFHIDDLLQKLSSEPDVVGIDGLATCLGAEHENALWSVFMDRESCVDFPIELPPFERVTFIDQLPLNEHHDYQLLTDPVLKHLSEQFHATETLVTATRQALAELVYSVKMSARSTYTSVSQCGPIVARRQSQQGVKWLAIYLRFVAFLRVNSSLLEAREKLRKARWDVGIGPHEQVVAKLPKCVQAVVMNNCLVASSCSRAVDAIWVAFRQLDTHDLNDSMAAAMADAYSGHILLDAPVPLTMPDGELEVPLEVPVSDIHSPKREGRVLKTLKDFARFNG